MADGENVDSTSMKVTVKTPKESHIIEINSSAGVKEVSKDFFLLFNDSNFLITVKLHGSMYNFYFINY